MTLLTFLIGLYLGYNLSSALKADRIARGYRMSRRRRIRNFVTNLLLP